MSSELDKAVPLTGVQAIIASGYAPDITEQEAATESALTYKRLTKAKLLRIKGNGRIIKWVGFKAEHHSDLYEPISIEDVSPDHPDYATACIWSGVAAAPTRAQLLEETRHSANLAKATKELYEQERRDLAASMQAVKAEADKLEQDKYLLEAQRQRTAALSEEVADARDGAQALDELIGAGTVKLAKGRYFETAAANQPAFAKTRADAEAWALTYNQRVGD